MNKIIFSILIVISCIPCALASSATITLDSVIDTPDRTIVYKDTNYEITDIGIYREDQNINAIVDVSGIRSFHIEFIDKDKNPIWSQTIYHTEGHETLIVPANTAKMPETYALAILYQGQILAVKPVVISVYELSVSSASQIEPGETLHVVVDISSDGIPVTVDKTVKVVLSQGSTLFEEVATPVDAGRYEADIEIPVIASGSFSLYCAVTTDQVILGYPEIIGAASYGAVNVASSETTPTSTRTSRTGSGVIFDTTGEGTEDDINVTDATDSTPATIITPETTTPTTPDTITNVSANATTETPAQTPPPASTPSSVPGLSGIDVITASGILTILFAIRKRKWK